MTRTIENPGTTEHVSKATDAPSQPYIPKIVAFLCNWCSYAGADLAGVSRFQYPSPIRIIRVMCSGRIDPYIIIETFRMGADGVLIGGCHPGDCHYIEGNYNAIRKINLTKKLLKSAGFDPERLRLEWISASEGELFARVVREFVEHIISVGQNPVTKGRNERLLIRLKAASDSAAAPPLRTLIGRQYKLEEKGNVHGETVPKELMERLVDKTVELEMNRHLILGMIENEPRSVKEIAKVLGIPADRVLTAMISLRMENRVGDAGHVGMSPLYKAIKAGGE
jgi:F420-non-reducing hydrogenase iron-sulfur subunit